MFSMLSEILVDLTEESQVGKSSLSKDVFWDEGCDTLRIFQNFWTFRDGQARARPRFAQLAYRFVSIFTHRKSVVNFQQTKFGTIPIDYGEKSKATASSINWSSNRTTL